MIINKKDPSWWRRMWTKIANKLLNRKCGSCRYWHGFGVSFEGACRRRTFFSLTDEYSWKDACCCYEKRH